MIQHPEDVERTPLKFAVVLHDCNETICDYCDVNLYSHRILSVTPKGFHSEMLLDPTEEQFHLPSLLVQHGYIFGLSESSPLIKAQTKVYGSGVKGVELTVKVKLTVYPLALSKIYHVISEFFEKPVVPVCIGVFQSTSGYNAFAESEMVTLLLMGSNDACQLPEAVTSGQLSEHHQQELVPARHCLGPLVCIVSPYHLVELFLWQKLYEPAEYVFSAVHASLSQLQAAMIRNQFKSFLLISASNLLYINN